MGQSFNHNIMIMYTCVVVFVCIHVHCTCIIHSVSTYSVHAHVYNVCTYMYIGAQGKHINYHIQCTHVPCMESNFLHCVHVYDVYSTPDTVCYSDYLLSPQ
jgi:hypothetical protein